MHSCTRKRNLRCSSRNKRKSTKKCYRIRLWAIILGVSAATARETGIQTANPENMSTVRAMAENVKIAPKAVAQAVGAYKPAPFTTLITAKSAELQNATQYISKPNEVKAYRFNPNGSEEEILANNPHVFKDVTKQAPGSFVDAPVGTEVKTPELTSFEHGYLRMLFNIYKML